MKETTPLNVRIFQNIFPFFAQNLAVITKVRDLRSSGVLRSVE
jgi:hypothetical protein